MTKTEKSIREKLEFLYRKKEAEKTLAGVKDLLEKYKKSIPKKSFNFTEKDVVLITYGDSFIKPDENPLKTLGDFLNTRLSSLVTIVHILPFFPYSSDDGFSVIDYKKVNPALGDWEDVGRLGNNFFLMFDAVVNHISSKSKEFQDFIKGEQKYKEFFIAVTKEMDISQVFRPRVLPLTTRFDTCHGSVDLWTTFSADQIDLNFSTPDVFLFVLDVLLFYAMHGASMIRLDAIAFLWKESGTTCLHLPQTHTVIKLYRQILEIAAPHIKIITETNVPHKENISYFGTGNDEAHMVYNFALPPLSVDALLTGDAGTLTEWARSLDLPGPNTYFYNFTASHDGIGLLPAHNILAMDRIQGLIEKTEESGGRVGYKSNADGTKTAYELNISLFDLLSDTGSEVGDGEISVKRFTASQAIALSLSGIPALYYHSIIGSRNYREGVKKTGSNRTINREKVYIENVTKDSKPKETELQDIDKWILSKYSKLVKKCTKQMDVFDYSQAMKEAEYFLWHELADHYIEMVKDSIYKKENIESIQYALYTVGLGLLKLFAPFFPNITEEIYWNHYKKFEGENSIHVSAWPEPVLIDKEKEDAGELVKNYISQVRSWKSEQGIALNAPVHSSATYTSETNISKIEPSGSIIKSTLKYPADHKFIVGKPDIEEKITKVLPVYPKLGPFFKKDGKKIVKWINDNQDKIIKKIEKKGDILISDIPVVDSDLKKGLLKNAYIKVEKETRIKGKKDSTILPFDGFYLEIQGK